MKLQIYYKTQITKIVSSTLFDSIKCCTLIGKRKKNRLGNEKMTFYQLIVTEK